MGHKVNPISLRLGITRTWAAKWYADKHYQELVLEDYKLRSAIKENYREGGVANVVIERKANEVTVTIFSSRPGIIIGKGGLREGSAAAFKDLGGVYLAIVGGAAALETTWVEQIEDVDLDDLNPESLWKFRVKNFGPLLVSMDSHGGSLYTEVNAQARGKRAAALASLGVKS